MLTSVDSSRWIENWEVTQERVSRIEGSIAAISPERCSGWRRLYIHWISKQSKWVDTCSSISDGTQQGDAIHTRRVR